MRINAIKNYSISRTNNIMPFKQMVFKGGNDDCFVVNHIKCLAKDMYKNPDLYLKDLKAGKYDLNDSFYIALLLRKEELLKPFKNIEQRKIKRLYKDAIKTRKIILKSNIMQNKDNLKDLMTINKTINNIIKEYKHSQYTGRDINKIKKWDNIGKFISKNKNFNPNYIAENGKSLINTALKNNDVKMAVHLISNKKIQKPPTESYTNEWEHLLYDVLDEEIHKNIFFKILSLGEIYY